MILKFLQWNIWYLEKLENIVSQLRELDADIICLQETAINSCSNRGVDTSAEIARAIGFQLYSEVAQKWQNWNKDAQGNGILSRFPIVRTQVEFIRDPSLSNPSDAAHEGRNYLEVDIAIGDKKITVGTTHLSYTHAFQETEGKREEAAKLFNCVKKNKEKYIISGDFNSLPGSSIVRNLEQQFVPCGPNYTQSTWTTKPFDFEGFQANTLDWRLDYVFCSPDLKIIESRIIETKASDHLPVMVLFEI